jgi:beta-1,4-mannosyl-glycoprotein beta-1,4-N-acetylglucosaminyltransferase
MKVIDCFLFSNELDMLEIRLNELNDKVDKFLICESRETFAGKPKELVYEKNKDRFSQFEEKIIHLVVEKFSGSVSAENREYFNRNYILNGIPDSFNDEDIIIFSCR